MNDNIITAQSPGRINIIGEHTDYNDGFVLPAAIDKKIVFELVKNGSESTVNAVSKSMNEQYSFDLRDYAPIENGWENYVMGVVHELEKIGAQLKGFDASFSGDVPIGGGLSSSAALECSLALGLNELFHLGFNRVQLIKASQLAEHNFVGIKCGIMDQYASMMGKKDQVMLLDCRSLEVEYFPCDLGDYQLLLLNTNVSHSLADSEYNTRREECEKGVEILKKQFPKIKNLRDVSVEMLKEHIHLLPDPISKRCHHVVTENNRVVEATKALTNGDFKTLGRLIYQSHFSLQNDYKVSCTELDFLVELTLEKDFVLGSRMMGGGFGGCTISLIDKSHSEQFIELAAREYRSKFDRDLSPYLVSIEEGGKLVSNNKYIL